jgi:hypothetical protein
MQTDWSLDGKVAMVTDAANGGIGEAYAHCLATAGGSVIFPAAGGDGRHGLRVE